MKEPKKPESTTVDRIPQWAVCYIVNADDSGLEPYDKKLVDDYVGGLERKGLRLVCPIDGTESEFELYPAFGLACGTVDFYAEKSSEGCGERDWQNEALRRAELIGVYEYDVNGRFMEYWSFFGKGEGWYFIRYDLEKQETAFRGANIPWDDDAQIPKFLLCPNGCTRYNYKVG